MLKTRLALMVLLAAIVVIPAQAVLLDDMSNIAARPWTDARDPGEGTGLLQQGAGVMKIDYGLTGSSDPLSGYDYLGNFVGVDGPGGAFNAAGDYVGKFDREIVGGFVLGVEMPLLTVGDVFTLDVFKSVAGGSEHVRELQLYDSLGARNTYQVQAEATADATPQGWTTYAMPLSSPLENNADLSDIVEVRLFVSAWSAYVSGPGQPPVWPDDYTIVRPTGTPVLIDNLQIIPEPATMTMLSLGGLALLRRRKK